VFADGTIFQPGGGNLVLPSNIRLGLKGLPVTNALAYFVGRSMSTKFLNNIDAWWVLLLMMLLMMMMVVAVEMVVELSMVQRLS